jgi:predicted ATPase
MKIVGLSGAQGGGKTSLLNELEKRGWAVDRFKVSRAVQAQLGWETLGRVMDSFETMKEFQQEVWQQKFNNDLALSQTPGARTIDAKGHVILTERTFADIFSYTCLWSRKFLEAGHPQPHEVLDFLPPYSTKCAEAQNLVYSGVILLPLMDHIVFEDDTHRASREDVEEVYAGVQTFMAKRAGEIPLMTITAKTVSDRADEVETFLRKL